MKKIVVTIIAAITIGLFACKQAPKKEVITEEIIPVELMQLQQDSIHQSIFAAGQFTTDDETNLAFKTGGVVNRVLVKEGDAITKGQLLATLNMTEVNAMAEQASLALQKAQRDYERASNLYKDSVATLERMPKLHWRWPASNTAAPVLIKPILRSGHHAAALCYASSPMTDRSLVPAHRCLW
jgi:multidrug efflux pump subunit AcrA (membrane-fusion protein)